MKITSKWRDVPSDERAVVTIGGRSIDVIFLVGLNLRCVAEVLDIPTAGTLHIAHITGPRKAIWQAGKPLSVAETGDVVILICATRETRRATLNLLGLNDPRTVFDTP
jgi:hypothetical protein